MASIINHLCLILIPFLLHTSPNTFAATTSGPKALVIPVNRDTKTRQYIIKINQRTPPAYIPLTLDLTSPQLWTNCDRSYVSSTFKSIQCGTTQCALSNSKCGTSKNSSCTLNIQNPFDKMTTIQGNLASDIVRANSTDGSNLGKVVSTPNFLFGCGQTPLQGLAKGVKGIAGLGRTSKVSLSSQFSSSFKFPNKFTTCLTSNWSTGVVFFGDVPIALYPAAGDVTKLLSYTPLIANPSSTNNYYIGLTSIKVNQTEAQFDKSLLNIDNKGNGGTMISFVTPYTVMHTSIYKAIESIFDDQLNKFSLTQVRRVAAVAPFNLCYDINSLFFTRIGVQVPDISLMTQSNKVWTIFGTNSMVQPNRDVLCLGIVDGGVNVRTSIVIGGFQLEDNLVQFDLQNSRLGFSSTLQYKAGTTCGNFNFTLA